MASTVQWGMTFTVLLYWNQDSWQQSDMRILLLLWWRQLVIEILIAFFPIQGELCVQILWQKVVEGQRAVGQCCLKLLRMQPMQYVSLIFSHKIINLLL